VASTSDRYPPSHFCPAKQLPLNPQHASGLLIGEAMNWNDLVRQFERC
jgi:hypothetical protein